MEYYYSLVILYLGAPQEETAVRALRRARHEPQDSHHARPRGTQGGTTTRCSPIRSIEEKLQGFMITQSVGFSDT